VSSIQGSGFGVKAYLCRPALLPVKGVVYLYSNILPEFGKSQRSIALDLPGCGLCDKPLDVAYDYDFYADTLDAFLDALGIHDTHLCMHDLGGRN